MSKTAQLALGMGGPTILMTDGDIANNIRAYAVQTLENCVFSQFDLDQTPSCGLGKYLNITGVTNATNEFALSAADIATLKVGDKVFLNWGGVGMPEGTIQEASSRPTEFKDKSIYFIQAIDTASNEVILEETSGAGAITLDSDGTLYGTNTWIAKLSDQDFSYGTFTRNASTNDRTHEIVGNVDGNIFKTQADSGLQINMLDTSGARDVAIPAGMTVYLPVTDITLTNGACIIYTRK
tara:strand:- start:20963 stop:21676 length:714 start_codon:yes stop_codon:yes gene_type:complete